jgi:hypothetical protein
MLFILGYTFERASEALDVAFVAFYLECCVAGER